MNQSSCRKCKTVKVSRLYIVTNCFALDSLIPSLDDYNMTELMNLVDELSHESKGEDGEKEEKEIDTSGKK